MPGKFIRLLLLACAGRRDRRCRLRHGRHAGMGSRSAGDAGRAGRDQRSSDRDRADRHADAPPTETPTSADAPRRSRQRRPRVPPTETPGPADRTPRHRLPPPRTLTRLPPPSPPPTPPTVRSSSTPSTTPTRALGVRDLPLGHAGRAAHHRTRSVERQRARRHRMSLARTRRLHPPVDCRPERLHRPRRPAFPPDLMPQNWATCSRRRNSTT